MTPDRTVTTGLVARIRRSSPNCHTAPAQAVNSKTSSNQYIASDPCDSDIRTAAGMDDGECGIGPLVEQRWYILFTVAKVGTNRQIELQHHKSSIVHNSTIDGGGRMEDQDGMKDNKLDLTAAIVSAYVSKNSVPMANLAELVAAVHASLAKLDVDPEPEKAAPVPAVPVRKSVTKDYIISLEDGRKFKSLKRHLATHYGMTPDQYRQKWGLPADYPMVAPSYAATRSALARSIGLGRKETPTSVEEGAANPAAKKPRRKKTAPAASSEES